MEDDAISHRILSDIYDQQQFRVDFQGNLKIEKIVEFADKKEMGRFYKVKWVKYVWQPEESILHFQDLYHEFWKEQMLSSQDQDFQNMKKISKDSENSFTKNDGHTFDENSVNSDNDSYNDVGDENTFTDFDTNKSESALNDFNKDESNNPVTSFANGSNEHTLKDFDSSRDFEETSHETHVYPNQILAKSSTELFINGGNMELLCNGSSSHEMQHEKLNQDETSDQSIITTDNSENQNVINNMNLPSPVSYSTNYLNLITESSRIPVFQIHTFNSFAVPNLINLNLNDKSHISTLNAILNLPALNPEIPPKSLFPNPSKVSLVNADADSPVNLTEQLSALSNSTITPDESVSCSENTDKGNDFYTENSSDFETTAEIPPSDIEMDAPSEINTQNSPNQELYSIADYRDTVQSTAIPSEEQLSAQVMENKTNVSSGKAFSCQICEKLFVRRTTLRRHMLIHSGDKPWHCHLCEKCFNQKSILNRHLLVHANNKAFQCPTCHKQFTEKGALKRHEATHSNLKNWVCKICGKSFILKEYLTKHEFLHSGKKPYKCQQCQRAFADKAALKRHEELHKNTEYYVCNICDRELKNPVSFKRHVAKCKDGIKFCYQCDQNFEENWEMHIYTHTSPFICRQCNAGFNDFNDFNIHLLMHKKEKSKTFTSQKLQEKQVLENLTQHDDVGVERNIKKKRKIRVRLKS